jgi:hypothetical protein
LLKRRQSFLVFRHTFGHLVLSCEPATSYTFLGAECSGVHHKPCPNSLKRKRKFSLLSNKLALADASTRKIIGIPATAGQVRRLPSSRFFIRRQLNSKPHSSYHRNESHFVLFIHNESFVKKHQIVTYGHICNAVYFNLKKGLHLFRRGWPTLKYWYMYSRLTGVTLYKTANFKYCTIFWFSVNISQYVLAVTVPPFLNFAVLNL